MLAFEVRCIFLQDYRARRFIDQKVEVMVSLSSYTYQLELIWLFCVTL